MGKSSWHSLYSLAIWGRRRAHQLRVEPLCRMCLEKGNLTPARVADHVEPHGGDRSKFILGRLQSLCTDCHDRHKRKFDLSGFSSNTNELGWPTDPAHPTNVRMRG